MGIGRQRIICILIFYHDGHNHNNNEHFQITETKHIDCYIIKDKRTTLTN